VDPADPIFVRQHECFLQGMANVERILRNAIAREQLPQDLDVRLACVTLRATVIGLLNNWLFAPDSYELEGSAEDLIDASLDMLRYAPSLRKKKAKG
jgi:TetR/AcrR family acrAB operon transcriptional repressor